MKNGTLTSHDLIRCPWLITSSGPCEDASKNGEADAPLFRHHVEDWFNYIYTSLNQPQPYKHRFCSALSPSARRHPTPANRTQPKNDVSKDRRHLLLYLWVQYSLDRRVTKPIHRIATFVNWSMPLSKVPKPREQL